MQKFDYSTLTERLVIRLLIHDDYPNWLKAFKNRLPSQNRHDSGRMDMGECTSEWFHNLVENHQTLALSDSVYVFGIFRKSDADHLGTVDFSTLARDDLQWGRIGYTIHNQYWRCGYGKEAVRGALRLAFEELQYHRIEAHINLDNTPSKMLAERAGMEFECIRKGFLYEEEEWTDHLIYYINAPASI